MVGAITGGADLDRQQDEPDCGWEGDRHSDPTLTGRMQLLYCGQLIATNMYLIIRGCNCALICLFFLISVFYHTFSVDYVS